MQTGNVLHVEKFETWMKDLPGDQVRALPLLITGKLRADRVRQTSSTPMVVVEDFGYV